jgi:hypothetical protein
MRREGEGEDKTNSQGDGVAKQGRGRFSTNPRQVFAAHMAAIWTDLGSSEVTLPARLPGPSRERRRIVEIPARLSTQISRALALLALLHVR